MIEKRAPKHRILDTVEKRGLRIEMTPVLSRRFDNGDGFWRPDGAAALEASLFAADGQDWIVFCSGGPPSLARLLLRVSGSPSDRFLACAAGWTIRDEILLPGGFSNSRIHPVLFPIVTRFACRVSPLLTDQRPAAIDALCKSREVAIRCQR
ncbi:hypothetical protein CONLIGDRAFT_435062 [Coniochaeta ligniaria NRRL 30616]|uniref:Uncharacterized protein n=1 Tax=Coniochaeta ligniaria NRRL 30616 TaxID=1408157 RepID=A0A1J7IJH3_9PEZI|nr:hypothetical protein CONLIGDRAFT_435062 [Coniochaeta ligniaria NRRL 30616]